MGMRYLIPGVMLRIGKDQEAYDFMKWCQSFHISFTFLLTFVFCRWCTRSDDHDWWNMKKRFLHIKNADVFEPVLNRFVGTYGPSLEFTAAMTLIKFRLLSALKEIKSGRDAIGAFLLGKLKLKLKLS